ncbi:hypothetical protein P4S52_15565 [Vibrio sp. SA48]
MLTLSILLIFIGIVLYFTVVVDMFKQKIWLGFLGLFLFPFTYYHAFKNYSGNKLRMGLLLVVTTLLPFTYIQLELSAAGSELEPFLTSVGESNLLNCSLESSVMSSGGVTFYTLFCSSKLSESLKYTSEKELVDVYWKNIVQPALSVYRDSFGKVEGKGVVLGIKSTSSLMACYKIENPGNVIEAWSSGLSEPCG